MTDTQNKITIADPPPVVCSSCGSQHVNLAHVDFGAAWDGPVVDLPETTIPHVVDDLIVCEQCLAEAFRVLAWHHQPVHEDVARLQVELDDTRTLLEAERSKNNGIELLRSTGWYAQHKPGRKSTKDKAA
jgi:hypothetical protein